MSSGRRGNAEGGLFKRTKQRTRKDGTVVATEYWCASVSMPDGRRKDFYCQTRSEAAKKLQKALQARDEGTLVVGKQPSLAQYVEDWLEHSVRPTTRPRTYLSYAERLRVHVLPTLGTTKLDALSPQQIQKLYASKLAAGLAPGTINGVNVVLHRALQQALKWGLVSRNVCTLVDVPQPKPAPARPLDADELARFREVIEGDRYEYLWQVLVSTGLRFGEAAALRTEDIDLDGRKLHVRHTITREGNKGYAWSEPKTRRSRRTIPLPALAVQALRNQQTLNKELRLAAGRHWTDLDVVFPSGVGTPIREPHLLVHFHKLLDQAGLERRRIHDLRATYATNLYALGVHPRAAQELMGHADIGVTMNVYTGAVPAVLRDAADSLDGLLASA